MENLTLSIYIKCLFRKYHNPYFDFMIQLIWHVTFALCTVPLFAGRASIWQHYERKCYLTDWLWFDSIFSKPLTLQLVNTLSCNILIYSIVRSRLSPQMADCTKSELYTRQIFPVHVHCIWPSIDCHIYNIGVHLILVMWICYVMWNSKLNCKFYVCGFLNGKTAPQTKIKHFFVHHFKIIYILK